jgi:hypothetical protein
MIVTNYRRKDLIIADTVIKSNNSAIVADAAWFAYTADPSVHDDVVNRRIVAVKERNKKESKSK